MNMFARVLNCNIHLRSCHRFINNQSNSKDKIQWLKPAGYETNISVYSPVAKCNVPFILRNKDYLTWYACGPTVYDSAHIGHAATYVKTDIIRRILSDHFNMNVIMVMGITDIDDKIITRAKEMNINYKVLAEQYENEFRHDLKQLNILEPNLYCRVTEYIPEILSFIESILRKRCAYPGRMGSVYFNTTEYGIYGKLANPSPNNPHPEKRSPLDFTLWKESKPGEPCWESPWGPGRPGWHTECSAIASKYFGKCIDVHSGGIDLAFPHHENEETQSCCVHGVEQWVNYWIHCGHLNVHDVKMSKSLKNTISIKELLKTHTSNEFRMLCLLSHYSKGIEFTNEVMQTAASTLYKIINFLADCRHYISGKYNYSVDEVSLLHSLNETKDLVNTSLSNDFNTAQALHAILKLIDTASKMFYGSGKATTTNSRNIVPIVIVSDYILNTLSKLGISANTAKRDWTTEKVNEIIEQFVEFRNTVRQESLSMDNQNEALLSACDHVRSKLLSCGITIKDNKNNSIWHLRK